MCGKIFCDGGENVDSIVYSEVLKWSGGAKNCKVLRTWESQLVLSNKLVGMVADGTECGPGRVREFSLRSKFYHILRISLDNGDMSSF